MAAGNVGETKRCADCGEPAILLSRAALNEILATLSLFGDGRLNGAYGPAWICSSCGRYEAVEPAPRPSADVAVTRDTPRP